MENKAESTSRSLKIILGIVAVLFIGTAIYTYTLYNEGVQTKKDLTEEKARVLEDLNNMAAKYETAIGENQVANEKLVEARERIIGLIDSLQVSDNNVKSLWRYKKKFMALQEELDGLLAENDSLKVENSYLATTLDSTKVQLEERIVFNDSLLAQNTELADLVETAAVLTTAGLKGFGVIERSSGKLIPTERARRADKLRICYTVVKNSLVSSGEKMFYIQVLDPNDNVLGLNSEIQFEEKVFNYSLISTYNYEDNNLDICEFITKSGKEDFSKGRYVVNVFNAGELVSSSEFTLK
jgi:regulator of replication initiation timing